MLNKTIYAIPGLGVDERVFYDLQLTQNIHYINWIPPLKSENLRSYAKRIANRIPNEAACILLGMSFGGVLAQEIASFREISNLILISSIKSEEEKPWKLRLMKYLPLYHVSRGNWRIKAAGYLAPAYGINKKEEIHLLKDMFSKFDDAYRMWSIRQLCIWEGSEPQVPFIHIHGDRDKIIPIKNIREPKVVKGGNHFMVKQKAGEISLIINNYLASAKF